MPSFDVVCEIDKHEITNAIDQANREVATRFDFQGVKASFEIDKEGIRMRAEGDFQLKQMSDILRAKLVKRGVDVGHLKEEEAVIQYKTAEQFITLQQGIPSDVAKKIVKAIKDQKSKVQTAIQGDQIRITAKKRDELQEVIAFLRQEDFGLPLQFNNFRD